MLTIITHSQLVKEDFDRFKITFRTNYQEAIIREYLEIISNNEINVIINVMIYYHMISAQSGNH